MRKAVSSPPAPRPTGEPLVRVRELSVRYPGAAVPAIEDVSVDIMPGEIFGLVGESGSGKSTVGRQLLSQRGPGLRVGGHVLFEGQELLALPNEMIRALRGARISFVPQNPTTALNPAIRIGQQIAEILGVHRVSSGRATKGRVAELLRAVGFPAPAEVMTRYPSQLSGGQQQRAVIAMAIACSPEIVVLDEPTTGLDVTTQRQVVDLLLDLKRRLGMTMVYITHDLHLLAELADRVGVMYAGRLVEVGPLHRVFGDPLHPYTQGLIASIPGSLGSPYARLRGVLKRRDVPESGCPFAPRCAYAETECAAHLQPLRAPGADDHEGRAVACWKFDRIKPSPMEGNEAENTTRPALEAAARADKLELRGLSVRYRKRRFLSWKNSGATAVDDASLQLRAGEILALIGESGSGKSSLARAICGIMAPSAGDVRLDDVSLPPNLRQRTREERRLIQYVFQNPDASLNPRMTVGRILERPLGAFFGIWGNEAHKRSKAILEEVGLDPSCFFRTPQALSGGERQRVAIARAVLAEPAFLICDEVLSALDVSIQSRVLDLLQSLRHRRRLGMLFISHDLSVVRQFADRVAVMYRGRIVAEGPRAALLDGPAHPYVVDLLNSAPGGKLQALPPTPATSGPTAENACVYFGRCRFRMVGICDRLAPPIRALGNGVTLACHLEPQTLPQYHSASSPEAALASG
ncbi:dipeptide ABC transporter ATP-binding protein [Hypericibacter sp.]|uniref:ABC transporter ATP-binding protein n=1 Tax=Hypericibacter sp. TaxID=2705401 RepID=UPI003D6D827C